MRSEERDGEWEKGGRDALHERGVGADVLGVAREELHRVEHGLAQRRVRDRGRLGVDELDV